MKMDNLTPSMTNMFAFGPEWANEIEKLRADRAALTEQVRVLEAALRVIAESDEWSWLVSYAYNALQPTQIATTMADA